MSTISDARNDYSLNLPRYLDTSEPEDIQDIGAHLHGGVPECDIKALGRFWAVIPGVRAALFEPSGRPGYLRLRVPVAEVKATVLAHPEFETFQAGVMRIFTAWRAGAAERLQVFGKGSQPKALVEEMAETLLDVFRAAPLLDAYDVFQHLMDYAEATLRDDVYAIAAEGWTEAARVRLVAEDKAQKSRARPDLVVNRRKYHAELVPPALLIARHFAAEQAAVEELETQLAMLDQEIEELAEEQGGEGGLLEDAATDKGKLTKASVSARLEEVEADADAAEERQALQDCLVLLRRQVVTGKKLKATQEALNERVLAKYGALTEAEVKVLVVEDKWLATMEIAVRGKLEWVSQALTLRVRELAERYASSLDCLLTELDVLETRVASHLKAMNVV